MPQSWPLPTPLPPLLASPHPPPQVMSTRMCEREAMRDATELAVLGAISHPNIVRVYSTLTDVVEVTGEWYRNISHGCGITQGRTDMMYPEIQYRCLRMACPGLPEPVSGAWPSIIHPCRSANLSMSSGSSAAQQQTPLATHPCRPTHPTPL